MEAYVVEDVSIIGLAPWTGPMPELHKPQVWIERADADRVKPILDEYERRAQERREHQSEAEEDVSAETINVICEGCEQTLSFPAAQRGSVEVCPHCGSYVDVEDSGDEDEWWLAGGENEETPA